MFIACGTCNHYFVTHDPKRPWVCSKFGFKSNILPSQEIKKTTGTECAYFSSKAIKVSSERDLNGK